jgi:polysaccharide export outer membrane protein
MANVFIIIKVKMKHLLFLIAPLLFFSCMTVPRNIAYFQDLDQYQQQLRVGESYEAVIKNNDQLLITISAPVLDQQSVAQFNLPMITFLTPGETTISQPNSVQTYTVRKDGAIAFPVLGKIYLTGLTKSQAIEHISRLISDYVANPIVNLQILSFRVTVLGEVARPGPISVRNERISVVDALGAAGDLTIYGERQNILLIRDNNGTIEYAKFDLTKADLFASPYYYLQQDDVLVVSSNKTRKQDSKYGAADSYRNSLVYIFFSAISIVFSFLGLLRK